MTHEESPWKDVKIDTEISHNSMREYFKDKVVSHDA
jgi:uncharacterized phage-associated protein